MKSIIPFATAAALTLLASNPLLAITYTWTGPASGGTWDTTATNFSAASGTPWDSTNGPSNIANFNTASLTATVSSVTTNGITFGNTATLSGSDITLAGTTPTITANANGSISSVLRGSAGLVKAGAAVLTLSAQNTFTGGTVVNAGTLELSFAGGDGNGGTLDSAGTLTINNGATVAGKANNPLGFGFISAKGVININEGGTLTTSNIFSMDRKITSVGGTIAQQVSGTVYNFRDLTGATYAFTSSSGGTASVISAAGAGLGGTATFNVTRGGGAIDLNVTGSLQNYPGATGALTKTGNGVMVLSNTNTYTGGTSVNAGILSLDNNSTTTARLANTSGVAVNSTGTLLLASSGGTSTNRINDTAAITLNGGKLDLGGFSEGSAGVNGVGALTLSANSTLDFGSAVTNNLIQFAGLGTHTGGTKLSILNWQGTANAFNGNDRLLFAGNIADFTGTFNQADVSFNGVTGFATSQFSGYFEVAAVPESSTWIGASLMVGLSAFHLRRRFQGNRVVC